MRAMVLESPQARLTSTSRAVPEPGPGQILVEIRACGVCRTDLHICDGELQHTRFPIVPGHEIVGVVAKMGAGVDGFASGQRVGIPWLGHTCGACRYCLAGQENLCDSARFTGHTIDGGFAEYTVADSRFCFPLPAAFSDLELAPWLCAGLIGYRALRAAGEGKRVGIYGFGAAGHIVAQLCRYQKREVYAFTKPGDTSAQQFARKLGVEWAGGSDERAPHELDAAVLFAPVGGLIPKALRDIAKGGVVICAGIHMSDIPQFPYSILWGERRVCSIANLTRRDGTEFIDLAQQAQVRTTVVPFPLASANDALKALREGDLNGAAVLTMR
jgi:alcohol dehydrogenase, propanol-preferring